MAWSFDKVHHRKCNTFYTLVRESLRRFLLRTLINVPRMSLLLLRFAVCSRSSQLKIVEAKRSRYWFLVLPPSRYGRDLIYYSRRSFVTGAVTNCQRLSSIFANYLRPPVLRLFAETWACLRACRQTPRWCYGERLLGDHASSYTP